MLKNYKAITGGVPTCGACIDAMRCKKNDALLVASGGPMRRVARSDVFGCSHCGDRVVMPSKKSDMSEEQIADERQISNGWVINVPSGASFEKGIPTCAMCLDHMKCMKSDALVVCAPLPSNKKRRVYRAGVYECRDCGQRVIVPQPQGFDMDTTELRRARKMGEWIIDVPQMEKDDAQV